jgi:hypothetical protein
VCSRRLAVGEAYDLAPIGAAVCSLPNQLQLLVTACLHDAQLDLKARAAPCSVSKEAAIQGLSFAVSCADVSNAVDSKEIL